MQSTSDIIDEIREIWLRLKAGKVTGQEARTYVALARTILDAKKVEMAMAHLNVADVPPVSLSTRKVQRVSVGRA